MDKRVVSAFALVFWNFLGNAHAAAPNAGWYGDIDYGASQLRISSSDINQAFANQGVNAASSISQSDRTFGLDLGYRINRNFAVEGAWKHLGDFTYSATTSNDVIDGKYKAKALSLAGLGIYQLSPIFSVYGKVGLASTHVDLNAASNTGASKVTSQSHAGSTLLLGIGAIFDIATPLFFRVGWDHYATVGDETTGKGAIDLVQIGVGARF